MADLLPSHRWYECDVCEMPQMQARLTPKAIESRTAKCALTFQCKGRMRGPIPSPFPGWEEETTIKPRKVKVKTPVLVKLSGPSGRFETHVPEDYEFPELVWHPTVHSPLYRFDGVADGVALYTERVQ